MNGRFSQSSINLDEVTIEMKHFLEYDKKNDRQLQFRFSGIRLASMEIKPSLVHVTFSDCFAAEQ